MTKKHWEHFHHQADIGVRGVGSTLAQAFEEAALALTAVITDPRRVAPKETVDIICEAPDREFLLVDWLNALIYEMATRGLLFCRFEVTISECRLVAKAWGEKADRERHEPAVEVKGATYTSLMVAMTHNGRWVAQTVVDV